jgi:hypothetical protein
MLVLFQGVTRLSEGLFYVAASVIFTETFDGSRIGRVYPNRRYIFSYHNHYNRFSATTGKHYEE